MIVDTINGHLNLNLKLVDSTLTMSEKSPPSTMSRLFYGSKETGYILPVMKISEHSKTLWRKFDNRVVVF